MAAHFAGSTACAGTLAQNITTAATPKARKSFIWGTFHPAFQTVARGAMVAMRASAGKQPGPRGADVRSIVHQSCAWPPGACFPGSG